MRAARARRARASCRGARARASTCRRAAGIRRASRSRGRRAFSSVFLTWDANSNQGLLAFAAPLCPNFPLRSRLDMSTAAAPKITPPPQGAKITIKNGKLVVPDNPIIPFIEGDGTGPDIWRASVRVMDAAVAKAYGGKR